MPIRDRGRRDTLALVGGGRWARVIASVLADLELPFATVVVVSRSNAAVLTQMFSASRFARFVIVPTIEEALNRFGLGAAIIANAARAHVASAERMIGAGIPVLIEKPAALSVNDGRRLLQMADRNGVCAMPSLPFLYCSYLDRFAEVLGSHPEKITRLRLEWSDPAAEIRYGERKSYDPGVSVAQDVAPHVWAILSQVAGGAIEADGVRSCRIARGGRSVCYSLHVDGVKCLVSMRRDAPARRRLLKAKMASRKDTAMDFSVEPGIILRGSTSVSGDVQWAQSPGPVLRQIQEFFSTLNRKTPKRAAEALLGSVALAERCDALLKQRQLKWLAQVRTEGDVRYALRDVLSARFYEQTDAAAGDAQALEVCVESALRLYCTSRGTIDIDALLLQDATAGMQGR